MILWHRDATKKVLMQKVSKYRLETKSTSGQIGSRRHFEKKRFLWTVPSPFDKTVEIFMKTAQNYLKIHIVG